VSVPVALVGCGAWGENLLRVLDASPRAELVAVADTSPTRRDVARAKATRGKVVARLEDAIALGARAVVIATPPRTHASLTLDALEAGLDVLVEKPLALRVEDAERCVERAKALGRVAMVGHLLRYHPAIERLVAMAREGVLGELEELSTSRLSVRGDRSVPALWSLGPHDLSILHALEPLGVDTIEATSGPDGDPVVLAIRTAAGLGATIELSRLHATKERRVSLAGSSRVAMIDDVRAPDRIFMTRVRPRGEGGAEEIRVAWREPIAVEVDHILRCVEERATPRTPFEEGAAVVRALELAARHLREGSAPSVMPAIAGRRGAAP
jgi:predicted dehydrogenase